MRGPDAIRRPAGGRSAASRCGTFTSSMSSSTPLLIVLLGPTASGKSTLALRAAPQIGAEIVNGDSMQMVRHLEIGTAKPSLEERSLVPHHLFDLVEPDEFFSAGAYMREARRVCREVAGRGRVPLVVGGTGLYLRVLLEGIFTGPGRSQEIRDRLDRIVRRRGTSTLHRILARRDPAAAASIQPGDRVRVVRALEVVLLTGLEMSRIQQNRDPLDGFRILKVGLDVPRSELYGRIDHRVSRMFAEGLIEEVQRLLASGYSPSAKAFEALGYRHAAAFLRGEIALENAIDLTQRDTRRYAKRQLTWFRREKDVRWLHAAGDTPSALDQFMGLLDEVRFSDGVRTGHRS